MSLFLTASFNSFNSSSIKSILNTGIKTKCQIVLNGIDENDFQRDEAKRKNIRDEFDDQVISIFIETPGENVSDKLLVLEERLSKRGDENPTLIKQRLRRFENEMNYKKRFEHHFINDDYDKTVDEIEKTIKRNLK